MSRFNFTNITLSSRADITKVMDNFNEIETNGINYNEVIAIRDALTLLIEANAGNISANSTAIGNLQTAVAGKAPTAHDSTANTYGVGTATKYGHNKVINNLTSSEYVDGESLSAYQGKILNDKITEANTNISNNTTAISGKAPTSHASSNTTYGIGTSSDYGHCRVINNLTTASHTDGTALSAYQGKVLNDAISTLNNSLGGMAKRTYSYGTAAPSGGSNGDVYDQYFT